MKNNLDVELREMGIDPAEPLLPAVQEVARPPHAHWARCKTWIADGLGDGHPVVGIDLFGVRTDLSR